jgi:hypothetical protein
VQFGEGHRFCGLFGFIKIFKGGFSVMQPAMQHEPGGASKVAAELAEGIVPQGRTQAAIRSSADYVELKYRNPANLMAGKMATGMGLFSLGLGLAEALMPGTVAKMIGVDEGQSGALRALGLREIGHGISIIMGEKPTAQMWARVGGDVMDLAYLGYQATDRDNNKTRLSIAAVAVLGAAAMDVMCAKMLSSQDWTVDKVNPKAPTNVGQPSARQPLI